MKILGGLGLISSRLSEEAVIRAKGLFHGSLQLFAEINSV